MKKKVLLKRTLGAMGFLELHSLMGELLLFSNLVSNGKLKCGLLISLVY